ncbi:MAG: hypothetical protein Q4G25_12580 [Paracoccus sp. (in: a-proteobacteria)]|nr:hypothetical protein [Paracoccus sp. (in: a-proteobacteria)]
MLALILGSTTMHETHEWLAARVEVPVIDPGPLTYKLAQIALDLKLAHSKAAYPARLVSIHDLIGAAGAEWLEGRR